MRDPKKFVGGEQHVVNADARLCGPGPHFFVSVVFRSRTELDDLLTGLTALRDGWDHSTAHIHLQDHELSMENRDPTRIEITFFTPTWADTETEKESQDRLVAEARKSLEKL